MTETHDKTLPEDEQLKPSRRNMIIGTGATVAGVAAVGAMFKDGFEDPIYEATQHGTGDVVDTYDESDIIHSMCMQCNTFCTIKVRLVDGGDTGATALVRKVAGNPYSPLTTQPIGPIPYDTSPAKAVKGLNIMSKDSRSRSGGMACLKGQAGPQIVHDLKRITKPMKRVGARGEGKWKTITWDEALKGILEGDSELGTPGLESWYRYVPQEPVMADWQKVQDGEMTESEFEAAWGEDLIDAKRPELGPKSNLLAILGGDRMQIIGERWALKSFGSINQFNHGGTCGVTGVVGNARSHPADGHKRMYADIDYCRYLIVWGTEPLTAQKGPTWLAPRIGLARANGMKMVVVDPRMSKTAEKADTWVPVKPGYDADLAWAMIRWIIENKRYDEQYLRAPGPNAAEAIGEPTWSDATHLVKVDATPKGKLNMVEAGLASPPEPDESGEAPNPPGACMVGGKLTAVGTPEQADLEVDTTVDTPEGPVRVVSVFTLMADRAMEKSMEEYAEACGIDVTMIEDIAREFTAHGKQAVVMSYRGPAMHGNGYHTIRALNYLNFLVGNHDWKGGHITAQKGYSPWKGRYDMQAVPNARKAWGVPITREKTRYEDTSFFKEDGYPAKRRWFPMPGNLCHEVIPSAEAGYPYSLNALFIHRHSPINSSPTGLRQAETLKNPDKIKLLVSFDVSMGDTSKYADYLLPDQTYLERFTQESIYPNQQYAVTQLGQPTTRAFKDPRPVEVTYLEIGKAMGLPGVGDNAFGEGAHWNTYEDYWLKVAANVAYATDNPVPDADQAELDLFRTTREKYLKDRFDEQAWKQAVTDEEWAKVVYVLNRGGRFEGHGDERSNGYEGEWLKYRYGGLCQFFDPATARNKDSLTGENFDGLAAIVEPLRADGTPVPRDGFPLHFINWKARHQGTHRTVNSAWLREVRPANFVSINPVDADERGIKNGDQIILRSPDAEVQGVAMLTQGIRPGVVGADAAFGHQEYGSKSYEVDGEVVEPPKRYGHEESARRITPMHEEIGYAGPRDAGFGVNHLLSVETLLGGGGMSDPIGGGAAQFDTWIEIEKA